MKKSNLLILSLVAAVAVTGCSSKKNMNGEGAAYSDVAVPNSGAMDGQSYAVANNGQLVGTNVTAVAGTNNIVYFAFDQSQIPTSEYSKLNTAVNALTSNTAQRVLLAGHADERGTREYNAALGEDRAMSVMQYLTSNGVSSGQIDTVSYGEERPAVEGNSEAAYTQNRRVELNYGQ